MRAVRGPRRAGPSGPRGGPSRAWASGSGAAAWPRGRRGQEGRMSRLGEGRREGPGRVGPGPQLLAPDAARGKRKPPVARRAPGGVPPARRPGDGSVRPGPGRGPAGPARGTRGHEVCGRVQGGGAGRFVRGRVWGRGGRDCPALPRAPGRFPGRRVTGVFTPLVLRGRQPLGGLCHSAGNREPPQLLGKRSISCGPPSRGALTFPGALEGRAGAEQPRTGWEGALGPGRTCFPRF